MTIKLTKFQEAFCQARIRKLNKTNAYREAYPNCVKNKWKPQSISKVAYRLAKLPKIKKRISYLKNKIDKEVVKEFSMSKVDILKKLAELISKAEINSGKVEQNDEGFFKLVGMKPENAIKEVRECLKEIGKLQGFYEDTLNLKGDKDNPIERNINITFVK